MADITYRELRSDETELLKDFLYEAIFVPEDEVAPPRDIIELPELKIYYEDFGIGFADYCMVAEDNGTVIGAAWTRIMNDYGHVDEETPSFAISVKKEYRNQGIGSELMLKTLDLLRMAGFARASLAVQRENYAIKLYEKVGFATVDWDSEEYIMVCDL